MIGSNKCNNCIEPVILETVMGMSEAVLRTYGPWPGGLWAFTPVWKPLTPAVSGISLFSNPQNLESDF